MKVVFTKKGYTPETRNNQPHATRRPQAAVFSVWAEDDEASDDGDVYELNDDDREPEHDGDSSSESSSGDEWSQDSTPSKKKLVDASDSIVDDSDGGEDFEAEAYISECQAAPLPDKAVFHWKKIRTVSVAPQYDDTQKLTGNYVFLCSCGFQKRIGVCCRHIFAVIFGMIINISDDAEDDTSCHGDATSIILSEYPGITQGLYSMNLCTKIKYHAALHQNAHLFKRGAAAFKVTVPKDVPQQYIELFMPDKDEMKKIPRNGLPPDYDDIQIQVALALLKHHIFSFHKLLGASHRAT